MLTKADDHSIHQTPESVVFTGTERNFYDRYFFSVCKPNQNCFIALAFGVYPYLNTIDASLSFIDSKDVSARNATKIIQFLHLQAFCNATLRVRNVKSHQGAEFSNGVYKRG